MARNYPNWIAAYMAHTQHSEAPDPLHFWTAVSTIAGALRRRVWIDQRVFDWTPNFYIVFIAPPGIATKSTSISIGMEMLAKVEDIVFGPNSMTWQGLTVALEESKKVYPLDPMMTEILQMSCLTIPISELGTFLKPKEEGLIDVLVDLWDGKKTTWKHRVKTGDKPSTEIVNPWMNIIGCTTPGWFKGNMPQYVIDGGLTSRCIFVFADAKRQFVAYPSRMILGEAWKDEKKKLVDDLAHIAQNIIGEYHLEEEAFRWGEQWYLHHWKNPRPLAHMSEKFGGYYARKQTHIHKLAMVVAASQRDDLVITVDDLRTAERIITATEGDIDRVFKTIGASEDSKAMAEVLAVVRAAGSIPASECWRRLDGQVNRKDFETAIKSLTESRRIGVIKLGDELSYYLTEESQPLRDIATAGT